VRWEHAPPHTPSISLTRNSLQPHTPLYTSYIQAHASVQFQKAPPFSPIRNLCKFGFRFPSEHADRERNLTLFDEYSSLRMRRSAVLLCGSYSDVHTFRNLRGACQTTAAPCGYA
jgi:hypothetical protein